MCIFHFFDYFKMAFSVFMSQQQQQQQQQQRCNYLSTQPGLHFGTLKNAFVWTGELLLVAFMALSCQLLMKGDKMLLSHCPIVSTDGAAIFGGMCVAPSGKSCCRTTGPQW